MTGEGLFAGEPEAAREAIPERAMVVDDVEVEPRYVPIGSGELVQLLGTGVLRKPDRSWNPFPPSKGVVIRTVVRSELSARIREICLPKARSSLVILEVDPAVEAVSEMGIALSQVAAIHVPDEKTWKKQEARFLQGDGWTLGGRSVRVSPDLFEAKPAEMERTQIGPEDGLGRGSSAIDRCLGGLSGVLLADWLDVDFRTPSVARGTFEGMARLSSELLVDLLSLDDVEARRLTVLVQVLVEEVQSASEERIEVFFRRLGDSATDAGAAEARARMLDIVESRETQLWRELTDDNNVVFRALTCATLEPDVSRLYGYLHAEEIERPGNKVAALALYITGAIAGVGRVPKRQLANAGAGFLPLADLALRCLETQPDEARDEIMNKAARIMGAKPDAIRPSGFSLFCNGREYHADIKRVGEVPRLVVSAKLSARGKGKAGLPQKTSHLIFTEVAPFVSCRVMADPNDDRSVRFESGLIVGNIDDPELEAAYRDIEDAIALCRSKVDRF
jgi:hypothetical protein